MHEIGPAADGTIFDVLLALSGGKVDRHDDFFSARFANVTGFVLHAFLPADTDLAGIVTVAISERGQSA